jgi:hypothetical protein
MQEVNFRTVDPAQAGDRVSSIQSAVYLDEVNHHAVALYTEAGAIAPGGKAYLKAGKAAAMTLGQPAPGPQIENGSDGATMKIIAIDAFRYTVKTGVKGINGEVDLVTFGGKIGESITFDAFDGLWYVSASTGVALSVAPVEAKPAAQSAPVPGKKQAPFGGFAAR